MLELADPATARLLDLLDGTRTEVGLVREATRLGIPARDAVALLAALFSAGLVVDLHALYPVELPESARRRLVGEANALALDLPASAPTPAARLRRRQAAHVVLTGSSQLAVPIATVLGAAGVGHVDPEVSGVTRLGDAAPAGLLPGDAHRPRGVAAAEAVRRAAPDTRLTPLRPGTATFAVLAGFSAPAALTALSHASRRLAHLSVTIRDGVVVVGPLVWPGRSPCLNCLDLHRRDRDPAWPTVSAQLHTGQDTADPVAAATLLVGAAYAAAEVLTYIDGGEPATLGATVEIERPGRETRRQWAPHADCGCVRAGAPSAGRSGGSPGGSARRSSSRAIR
jgi:bacteriocin biosynthesis cyclodehydratase domain-containing protein